MAWILILITAFFDVVSSIFIKEWTLNNKLFGLIIGVVCLAISGISFAFSMKYFGLAVSNVLWNSFSTIFLAAVAIFFFHEKLAPVQIAGIFVVVLGVALVGK
jgi:multidrug transporter EmrE-like cation transporter